VKKPSLATAVVAFSLVSSAAAPDEPQYTAASGKRYFAQPDAQGAVSAARQKLDADPQNVALLIALGDAYATIWDHREAIAAYDRALALDGKLAGAWYYLGLVEYLDGRFDKAAECYLKNFELNGSDLARGIAAVDWLYSSYRRGKQDDAAATLLARVTADLAIEGNARLYLNRLLFYKGLRTEAELLGGTPSEIEATTLAYGVAGFHLANGDVARARALLEKAVSTSAWPALAFIAAERDLERLGGTAR
jgi:tetratricopeptide (TPR) repeat protein